MQMDHSEMLKHLQTERFAQKGIYFSFKGVYSILEIKECVFLDQQLRQHLRQITGLY